MNEEFAEERIRLIRELADKADPFIKQRLLALMNRYSEGKRGPFREIPHRLANLSAEPTDKQQVTAYLPLPLRGDA